MFPFMDFPAEIRALVLEHALLDSRDPPGYPSKEGRRRFWEFGHTTPRYGPYWETFRTHSPSNALQLLLTSRQISAETQAVLNLVKETNYHLDISVLDDDELYATWLCVPRLSTRIDVIEVDVRLFGNIIYPQVAARHKGDGGHTRYEWDFLVLLERFLTVGPVSQKRKLDKNADQDSPVGRHSYSDREIKVKTIVLNFSSAEEGGEFPPREISYEDWQWQCMARPRNRDEIWLEEYNTRPEWLAELLSKEIHHCLHFERNAGYGKLMMQRLGKIKMFVDGKPFQEIDVAGRLDDLKYRPQGQSVPDWIQDI
ncbi:hypothetical protein BDV19DRAFT_353508 [Aspergillus venezuelensis]